MNKMLIGFDLDKTLIKSAAWYRLNLAMGISDAEDEALYKRGPEMDGELNYTQWLGELASLYRSRGKATKQAMEEVILDFKPLAGAKEAVAKLQNEGHQLAIITGGFQTVAREAARQFGISYTAANVELTFSQDAAFEDLVLQSNDDRLFKAEELARLAKTLDIPKERTFYVADGDNDDQVFTRFRGIQILADNSSHEAWKANALAAGQEFSLHHAGRVAEFILPTIADLPQLINQLDDL